MLHLKYNINQHGHKLDLQIDVPVKGIVALFGNSGAGKTTILRIIAGLESDYRGILKFEGKTWQDHNLFVPTHLRKIGYVFQNGRLFEHLSVAQNLAFASKRSKIEPEKVKAIIDELKLGHLLQRMPNKLSGGEKQRIVFARCLLTKPKLLLLDEPFNALETDTNQLLLTYVRKLNLPTIYVSHSADEVMRIADYLVHIKNGEILHQGKINQMLSPLGRNGFIVNGELISSNQGYCNYQTNIGSISFLSINTPLTTRIFVDSRNINFFAHKAEGRLDFYIDSIDNKTPFYYCLNLSIANEKIKILVPKDKFLSIPHAPGTTVYAEISQADII